MSAIDRMEHSMIHTNYNCPYRVWVKVDNENYHMLYFLVWQFRSALFYIEKKYPSITHPPIHPSIYLGVGDQIMGLKNAIQMLYHWATVQSCKNFVFIIVCMVCVYIRGQLYEVSFLSYFYMISELKLRLSGLYGKHFSAEPSNWPVGLSFDNLAVKPMLA